METAVDAVEAAGSAAVLEPAKLVSLISTPDNLSFKKRYKAQGITVLTCDASKSSIDLSSLCFFLKSCINFKTN